MGTTVSVPLLKEHILEFDHFYVYLLAVRIEDGLFSTFLPNWVGTNLQPSSLYTGLLWGSDNSRKLGIY